jgi:hypothetical protein
MLGHVHDLRPETATRNFGDVAEMALRQPEKFEDPTGKPVPFWVFSMDGGKGARSAFTCFIIGLFHYGQDADCVRFSSLSRRVLATFRWAHTPPTC